MHRGRTAARVILLSAACAAACNGRQTFTDTGSGTEAPDGGGAAFDMAWPFFPPGPIGEVVYAHSDSELFHVDTDTFQVVSVGRFDVPGPNNEITDIALDAEGHAVGITLIGNVYAIDPSSAKCRFLASLKGEFNALSFVPRAQIDGGAGDALIAVSADGELFEIDPATGDASRTGRFYGPDFVSSGDLVSVKGATYATTLETNVHSDVLVRVDPTSGHATPIGPTGAHGIWGLGYWKGKIYGFTEKGQILLIDPATGQANTVATTAYSFWGAGVTTSAPTIQ